MRSCLDSCNGWVSMPLLSRKTELFQWQAPSTHHRKSSGARTGACAVFKAAHRAQKRAQSTVPPPVARPMQPPTTLSRPSPLRGLWPFRAGGPGHARPPAPASPSPAHPRLRLTPPAHAASASLMAQASLPWSSEVPNVAGLGVLGVPDLPAPHNQGSEALRKLQGAWAAFVQRLQVGLAVKTGEGCVV